MGNPQQHGDTGDHNNGIPWHALGDGSALVPQLQQDAGQRTQQAEHLDVAIALEGGNGRGFYEGAENVGYDNQQHDDEDDDHTLDLDRRKGLGFLHVFRGFCPVTPESEVEDQCDDNKGNGAEGKVLPSDGVGCALLVAQFGDGVGDNSTGLSPQDIGAKAVQGGGDADQQGVNVALLIELEAQNADDDTDHRVGGAHNAQHRADEEQGQRQAPGRLAAAVENVVGQRLQRPVLVWEGEEHGDPWGAFFVFDTANIRNNF